MTFCIRLRPKNRHVAGVVVDGEGKTGRRRERVHWRVVREAVMAQTRALHHGMPMMYIVEKQRSSIHGYIGISVVHWFATAALAANDILKVAIESNL
jgi:hypothetical protein